MENCLQRCLDDIVQVAGVKGCLLADEQGLCIGTKGKIVPQAAGVIVALANQAGLLEPDNQKRPIVILENDNRQCFIHQTGKLTVAIQKSVS